MRTRPDNDELQLLRNMPKPHEALALREDCGVSRGRLAATIGVDISTLFDWETERRTPLRANLINWAKALEDMRDDPGSISSASVLSRSNVA